MIPIYSSWVKNIIDNNLLTFTSSKVTLEAFEIKEIKVLILSDLNKPRLSVSPL